MSSLKVFLVVGGRPVGNRQRSTLSSTELWTRGTSHWRETGELPVRVFGAVAVTMDNVVHLTGGEALMVDQDTYDLEAQAGVYTYDGEVGRGKEAGNMTTTRYYHAATVVTQSDFSPYCTSVDNSLG